VDARWVSHAYDPGKEAVLQEEHHHSPVRSCRPFLECLRYPRAIRQSLIAERSDSIPTFLDAFFL
jgi:hypothetical protein